MTTLLIWIIEKYLKKKQYQKENIRKRALKILKRKILIALIIDIIIISFIVIVAINIRNSLFDFMTAGVVQVVNDIIEDVKLDDKEDNVLRIGDNCPCGNCVIITNNEAYSFTTGNTTGNNFDMEVLKLCEALANDTDSFVWMPYAKSAVEYSGALTKRDSIYTNYSSIYVNYTDKLSKADRWGSIGIFQITESNAKADTFSSVLMKNSERFNRAVNTAGGTLSEYKIIADKYADNIYEDRLFLPSQLGTIFYYYEAVRNEYINIAKTYVPDFDSLNPMEQEVVLEMIYLASWNNGLSNTKEAFRNSEGGKLGQYMADLAKLFADDNHFRQLISLEGVSYLGGNTYTKTVESVLKYMGKNVSDYINSTEVNGGPNDWVSRTYCYATNGLLGGAYLFKKVIESNGGNITGSLAKIGGQSTGVTATGFENIKLSYTAESVDGPIQREYETVYGPLDYHVNLLEIGDDYANGGSSDLPNRKLNKIGGIVIHYTGREVKGTAESVREWYDKPYNWENGDGSYTSAHFAIGADGKIIQMAPLDNEVIMEGVVNRDKIVIDVNYETVNGAFGSKAYNSLLHLVAWLCAEFNIDTDTNFVKASGSLNNVLYRDLGEIQRHYDLAETAENTEACPLYWVPNDGSANDSGTTDGGNSRWISFKKDLTSFILTYKDKEDFAPTIDVPGLAEAKVLANSNSIPNWKSGTAIESKVIWGCSCGIPCDKCDCHGGTGTPGNNAPYSGKLTGRAKTTDFGYGTFKGSTWASSQFLDNAKTVIKAMIDSGYGYSQSFFYDPFGDFYKIRYDCSGYVSAVLHYSGYTSFRNHTSRNFAADWDKHYGWKKIYDIDELQPGDIMVMEAGGRSRVEGEIGHVQIYAGDKKVYSVGSDDYLINHPNGNPANASNHWSETADRFLFAWRITAPNN